MNVQLHLGDCLEVLATLPENSVDTCITDPPYELGFMGKKWDSSGVAFQPETWQAVFRVLKPGAILLAFGGTRTYHRMVCAIEDAGFEIRDTIAWVYGSGFPKSYDISKGIDKQAGAKREVTSSYEREGRSAGIMGSKVQIVRDITTPSTPEAQIWDGWGTALKPAFEPIVVAMKPIDGTFVNNALTWGVAGLWIDGGRVGYSGEQPQGSGNPAKYEYERSAIMPGRNGGNGGNVTPSLGRFPANFIHDGSDEVVGLFPHTVSKWGNNTTYNKNPFTPYEGSKSQSEQIVPESFDYDRSGSAARFFYCAKASRAERNAGLEGMPEREWRGQMPKNDPDFIRSDGAVRTKNLPRQNFHPTVKPLALMRYLVHQDAYGWGSLIRSWALKHWNCVRAEGATDWH